MPINPVPWLAIAGCLLITVPVTGTAQRLDEPAWAEPEARSLAASPAVERASEALLELTLEGADARRLIAAIGRIRSERALAPALRDAALLGYVERLRELSPGSAPPAVLQWLAETPPLAVTGHEEGAHHPVPLFNVAGAARGLANEWAWQRGHDDLAGNGPLSLSAVAGELGGLDPGTPRFRGIRAAIERLPGDRLDALAAQCAILPDGCGQARADIELARANAGWLREWLPAATPQAAIPRLQRIRHTLPPAQANELMKTALRHPDKGVAAWAMSDITAHLPKDASRRQEWGNHLVGLLDDPDLGGAAALQLARMGGGDWLEAAAARELTERGRRRLQLLAELESSAKASETETEAIP